MPKLSRRSYGAVLLATFTVIATCASSASPRGWEREFRPIAPIAVHAQVKTAGRQYAFPLRASTDRRYLVDRKGAPFMIVGDSPQALIANLSVKDAATFIADRKKAGFNALWVNLLCVKYTGCRADGSTYDGITPFTRPGDLSTPNPVYFQRAATMLGLARKAGMAVFLDPIETGGWLGVLRANGAAKDAAYGRFLARRFRSFTNIVWMSGNDFQSWRDGSDDAVVLAVARGIRSVTPSRLQTAELNYLRSSSRDDARWRGVSTIDAAYTYMPTYAEVLREYDRRPALPVFMVEAGYEFEQNIPSISYGDPRTLRRQEYWTALSGATGQFYGNHFTWQFAKGWKQRLDTLGSAQLGYLVNLFANRPWFRLVPDQAHKVVTAGYGTFVRNGSVDSSDYVTTAVTPDRSLSISYLPAGGKVTVALGRLQGPVRAQWYDPANGTYQQVAGSPFPAVRSVVFTAPGANADGDRDWVLVLSRA